ncbi:hypothetical protein GQX73_g5560 [Xylaria multiplex]|uniref:Uncharacterized protein n=1 Tax=Xylaria multiplex TaxID=323545 RepID=A0A7C8MQK8_9PEZI|nr:hypothetical protein GQX73_g5560 [Xylaria multiplex]
MTTQNMSDQDGLEDIPVLTTIAPSIFVPTDRDFTKTPPPLSDEPIARLETTIEALDWHAARVDENIISMLAREAERVRRAGYIERMQYDVNRRPIKVQQTRTEHELILEEILLREDEDAVLKILRDAKYRDNEDVGGSREGPRERRPHNRSRSPPLPVPRPRGPRAPENADLHTLRHDRMFRLDVDELRQTPRSVALTHILNLIKWGWDDQLEGHRAAVKKEKDDRRANLDRQMKGNPFPLSTTGPTAPVPTASAPVAPGRPRKNSIDIDAMDIDI